jgi:hypothetical protein
MQRVTPEVETAMRRWLESDDSVLRRHAEARLGLASGEMPRDTAPPTPDDIALRAYLQTRGCGCH